MAKNVQFLGMSASQLSTVLGLARQCIVDTTAWTLRVMDGVTPGGFALLSARNNLSDIPNPTLARNALGLGSAAVEDTSFFDLAGAAEAAQAAAEAASDPVGSAATAQTNAISTSEAFATAADVTNLNAAKAYADAGDTSHLATAEAYTNSQIAAQGLRIGTAEIFVQSGGSPPGGMQNGDICVIL